MKKKLMIGLIAGTAVFAAVFGAAASLGTITDGTLGASNTTVAACDSGLNTSYTVAWDATDTQYEVATVTVSGIAAACDTRKLNVSIQSGVSTLSLPQTTINESATPGSETLTLTDDATRPTAAAVDGIHVAING